MTHAQLHGLHKGNQKHVAGPQEIKEYTAGTQRTVISVHLVRPSKSKNGKDLKRLFEINGYELSLQIGDFRVINVNTCSLIHNT